MILGWVFALVGHGQALQRPSSPRFQVRDDCSQHHLTSPAPTLNPW